MINLMRSKIDVAWFEIAGLFRAAYVKVLDIFIVLTSGNVIGPTQLIADIEDLEFRLEGSGVALEQYSKMYFRLEDDIARLQIELCDAERDLQAMYDREENLNKAIDGLKTELLVKKTKKSKPKNKDVEVKKPRRKKKK